MKVYIIEWHDHEYNSRRCLIVAKDQKEACDLFEAKHKGHIDENSGWSVENVPLRRHVTELS